MQSMFKQQGVSICSIVRHTQPASWSSASAVQMEQQLKDAVRHIVNRGILGANIVNIYTTAQPMHAQPCIVLMAVRTARQPPSPASTTSSPTIDASTDSDG